MTAAGGSPATERRVVIGVGNEYRRDDGVGPAVLARLRDLQREDPDLAGVTLALSDGEPSRMMDLWAGADLAVVVDALRGAGVPAGHRFEVAVEALTGAVHRTASSHGIDLGETVELATALGRMPARLVVLAVAGHEFGFGTGLSAEVEGAVAPLVQRVREAVCRP